MHPDHARRDELADAFALIFAHLPADESRWRINHALTLVERGELDTRGVFVLRNDTVAGAIVCSLVEGGGSLIWPPGLARHMKNSPHSTAAENALVRRACAWLREHGARLTQCLLPPTEEPHAVSLLRNGFHLVTHLAYLQHELIRLPSSHTTATFEPYRPAAPAEFHDTLALTYDGTQDCPELNGIRSIDEVIEGHKVQGIFDPSRWWLVRNKDREAIGVLLLMAQPQAVFEVVYMGVVPAWRGRGVGCEMLAHALCEAKIEGAQRVTLSVDLRNTPAWRLYCGAGFTMYDRRAVILAIWTPQKDAG